MCIILRVLLLRAEQKSVHAIHVTLYDSTNSTVGIQRTFTSDVITLLHGNNYKGVVQ